MLVYERDYIRAMSTLFGPDAFKMMRRKPEGIPYVPSADEMLDAVTHHFGNAKKLAAAKEAKQWLEEHLPTQEMYAEAYARNEPSILALLSPSKKRCEKDAEYRRDVKYWRFERENAQKIRAAVNFDKVAHALYAENGRGLFTLAHALHIAPERLDRAMQTYCSESASEYLGHEAEHHMRKLIGPKASEFFAGICEQLKQGRGLDELFAEKGIGEVQTLEDPGEYSPSSLSGERLSKLGRQLVRTSIMVGGLFSAYQLGKANLPRQWMHEGIEKVQELRYREDYARRHGLRPDERNTGSGISMDGMPSTDTTSTLDFSPRMLYPPVSSAESEPKNDVWSHRIKSENSTVSQQR